MSWVSRWFPDVVLGCFVTGVGSGFLSGTVWCVGVICVSVIFLGI